jgi:Holliday junction DNA helicase RuvA
MIGRLSGVVLEARPDEVIVDVAGVGYQVQIPLTTFFRLHDASKVSLHIHTHVREDSIQLFGFWSQNELGAFERLIAISGIGPKLALAVLSGIGVEELQQAVSVGDRAPLEKIPGIGRKTAERMLLELRESPTVRRRSRFAAVSAPPSNWNGATDALESDAASALVHLGYPESTALEAVSKARRAAGGEPDLETILRSALRTLVR